MTQKQYHAVEMKHLVQHTKNVDIKLKYLGSTIWLDHRSKNVKQVASDVKLM